MSVSCGVCGRTGEPPIKSENIPTSTEGPWALIQITELRVIGDSEKEPNLQLIVCSKTCAIQAVITSEIRDVLRSGFAP